MNDTTTNPPDASQNCATCRFHTRQPRPQPLWVEQNNGVQQLRTLDDDVNIFVCRNSKSEHSGKEFLEPVHCDGYSDGRNQQVPTELERRMQAAMERLKTRKDHQED